MTLDDRVRIVPGVLVRTIEGETVLLNPGSGGHYGLDQVGSRLWELLAELGSLRAVFERMAEEYDVKAEDLRRDMLTLVQELADKGLIEIVG
jgi:hypothetical protein